MEKEIIEYLWQIIDDIDTVSDIAKSNDISYRNMVEKLQKKRWNTGITTDGYTLDLTNMKTPNTIVETTANGYTHESTKTKPSTEIYLNGNKSDMRYICVSDTEIKIFHNQNEKLIEKLFSFMIKDIRVIKICDISYKIELIDFVTDKDFCICTCKKNK